MFQSFNISFTELCLEVSWLVQTSCKLTLIDHNMIFLHYYEVNGLPKPTVQTIKRMIKNHSVKIERRGDRDLQN